MKKVLMMVALSVAVLGGMTLTAKLVAGTPVYACVTC